MSNTLSLPRGTVDFGRQLEGVKKLSAGLTGKTHRSALDALDKVSKYTPQSGNTLADVAESLGISRNVLAASLMMKSTDNIPSAWAGKEIQYQDGWITLPSGTKYPVAESHNDE